MLAGTVFKNDSRKPEDTSSPKSNSKRVKSAKKPEALTKIISAITMQTVPSKLPNKALLFFTFENFFICLFILSLLSNKNLCLSVRGRYLPFGLKKA